MFHSHIKIAQCYPLQMLIDVAVLLLGQKFRIIISTVSHATKESCHSDTSAVSSQEETEKLGPVSTNSAANPAERR